MPRGSLSQIRPVPSEWMFVAWLVVIFFLGGSSRDDVAALIILRPLSVLVLCGLLMTTTKAHLEGRRVLLGLMAAALLLPAIHLVPLPPTIWQALPGRDLIVAIDEASGLQGVWRPLSISPEETRNTMFSLVVPASILIWMTRFDQRQRLQVVLVAFLCIALFSALLGLLQISSADDTPLYLYRISNAGSPIGFFANRNHQAVFLACMLPLLAVYASRKIQSDPTVGFRLLSALGGAAFIVLFLLLLGSRAGIITGVLGLVSMPFVGRMRLPDRFLGTRRIALTLAAPIGFFGLFALAIINSRSEALDRLLGSDEAQDVRFTSAPYILQVALDYLPFGSGLGTFVQAWHVAEPDEMLEPRYLNHAHNDFLEVILTGGMPATLLVITALGLAAVTGWRSFRASIESDERLALARGGFVIIFLLLLASIVDYPLRTPALMALAAFAAASLGAMPAQQSACRTGRRIFTSQQSTP